FYVSFTKKQYLVFFARKARSEFCERLSDYAMVSPALKSYLRYTSKQHHYVNARMVGLLGI
ncbi:TPA: hypothetical protein ACH9KV_004909, partial [Escherichia coli]